MSKLALSLLRPVIQSLFVCWVIELGPFIMPKGSKDNWFDSIVGIR